MTSPIFAKAAEEWARMRSAYQDYLEAHMQAAETATNGYMLNARGRAAGIRSDYLFTSGPSVAKAYASEELTAFWARTPRPTLARFEAGWVDQRDQESYDWDGTAAA